MQKTILYSLGKYDPIIVNIFKKRGASFKNKEDKFSKKFLSADKANPLTSSEVKGYK